MVCDEIYTMLVLRENIHIPHREFIWIESCCWDCVNFDFILYWIIFWDGWLNCWEWYRVYPGSRIRILFPMWKYVFVTVGREIRSTQLALWFIAQSRLWHSGERVDRRLQCSVHSDIAAVPAQGLWQTSDWVQYVSQFDTDSCVIFLMIWEIFVHISHL